MGTKWQVFSLIFTSCCFFLTTGLVSYWIYKFPMNEDLSTVEYKEYDSDGKGTPYLSNTVCFRNPFVNTNKDHLNQSQMNEFVNYFSGNEPFKLPDRNYKETAINLTDYVEQYYLRLRNGTKYYFVPENFTYDVEMPWFFKCRMEIRIAKV